MCVSVLDARVYLNYIYYDSYSVVCKSQSHSSLCVKYETIYAFVYYLYNIVYSAVLLYIILDKNILSIMFMMPLQDFS